MLSQKPWLPHTVSLAHSSMSMRKEGTQGEGVNVLFTENTYLVCQY